MRQTILLVSHLYLCRSCICDAESRCHLAELETLCEAALEPLRRHRKIEQNKQRRARIASWLRQQPWVIELSMTNGDVSRSLMCNWIRRQYR